MRLAPNLRGAFLTEIETQAKFATASFVPLVTLTNPAGVWLALHAFLTAAGNLSKIFWPSPAYADRGNELRAKLGIPDASPLKDRRLRNILEHFDKELDKWAKECPEGFIDSNIGPLDAYVFGTGSPDHCRLRHLDQDAAIVIYRGERFELGPINDAIEELRAKIPPFEARFEK